MFCRTIEVNKTSGECFIVEETSDQSVPAEGIDVYEPICLNERVDAPCDSLHVFERIPNVNLVAEDLISQYRG